MSGTTADSLETFEYCLCTEIENVSARICSASDAISDVKGFCELVNSQLEALKLAIKYEIGVWKNEIRGESGPFDVKICQNLEFKRITDELNKAKQVIKLHHLSGLIGDHINEKFK